MKKHTTIVSVEAVTWSRESHGLFDYESQHVSKRNLKAASSAKIIRIKNDIRLVTDIYNEKNVCENSKTLALLKHQDGVFTLTKTDNTEDTSSQAEAENFWLVVKNLKKQNDNQEYILAENDIIKLGRIKFRVKELKVLQDLTFNGNAKTTNSDETVSLSHNNSQNEPPRPHKIDQTFENQEAVCRICLNSENTEKNPLISPCSCSGSVKHIHLSCLKHWIKSKSNIKSSGLSVSYSWKSLECELCHQALPESFLHNNLTIELIDLPKPNSNYVVLESMSSERQSSKTYYVVLASAEDTIKLGRGHECDVRINDISVSRLHAFIRYSSGKFYLADNQSKFGTLVHLKNDFRILPDYTTSVQIGRSVISFTLMTKNQSVSQQSPNLFKALSTYVTNNELSDDCDQDLDKIQSLFQRKKDPTSQNFTNISEKVQIGALSAKANSLYVTSKKEEASSLNTKLFNLTLDKDKDDYSHLQELLKNHNNKHKMDINRAKSNEDKFRERKNILNEMKNLNLNEDDDEENDENDPYNDFILRKNPL